MTAEEKEEMDELRAAAIRRRLSKYTVVSVAYFDHRIKIEIGACVCHRTLARAHSRTRVIYFYGKSM